MTLVRMSKQLLQMMRDDEWEALLTEVSTFCSKHDIPILNMEKNICSWCEATTQRSHKLQIYITIVLIYSLKS